MSVMVFDCNLNKKGSINVKINFKISLIIISVVSIFWPNSIWWYIIFVLRQRIICINIKSNLWIEKCLCKKTVPNVRQRACCYFFQRCRNYRRINNSHIVKLIPASDDPITIVMEFCTFSFTPFNRDATVNSLDESLS